MSKPTGGIRISTEDKVESERLIFLLIVGVLSALKSEVITIEDAEQFLFSPYTARILKEYRLNGTTIHLVWLGAELENVLSLIPDRLEATYDRMIKLAMEALGRMKRDDPPMAKWIDEPL